MAEWETATRRLALDSSLGSPWLLLPGDARTAFDSVQASGLPLAESLFGRPLLGVKTGCNDAFLVSDEQKTAIEPAILRPAIRGEMLQKWACSPASHSIIWTHDEANRPLASLPPGALKHLSRWRRELEGRADGRRAKRWWMLFRTAAANSDVARVVWSDIGRSPRAVVLRPGDPAVPLNTCYVVRAPSLHDALALATILNGTLAAAWLSVIAELARGGYRRFMGWCVSAMPLPRDWPRAATILAPLAARASDRAEVTQDEIDEAVLDAFMLPARSVRALLDWV